MYFFVVKTARHKCDLPRQAEEENLYFYLLSNFFSAESVLPHDHTDELLHEN